MYKYNVYMYNYNVDTEYPSLSSAEQEFTNKISKSKFITSRTKVKSSK